MAEWSAAYAYTEANVRARAPMNAGVYRLLSRSSRASHVLYVGQTNNLQWRLLQHLSPSEPDACIKRYLRDYVCSFRFVEIVSS